MEKQHCNPLQNFDGTKSEILKKRLLKSVNTSTASGSQQSSPQNNALLNPLRAPISNSMLVSSLQAPQSPMTITHNFSQSLTPLKIHPNNHPYPLHLSTVHVPVQIPGSTSNINVPVQLSGASSTVPLQLTPVSSTANLQLLSNVVTSRPNIAPKMAAQNKSSILAPVNTSQPIVIQKPKDKVMVPVSIAPGGPAKQAIAYLGQMKKPNSKNLAENQSILITNNQPNNPNNKLFLTPMNMPLMQKQQNTKFILPVTLPPTMASKGPIINLQIANGQIQNDPQGNITVMRDTGIDPMDMPPLHPLGKIMSLNGKDNYQNKMDSFTSIAIPGSRAEPTGEQGEYTLSIPETNSAMNDDIYTVSIEDDQGQTREESFTLAIPEKSNSLLNKNVIDRNDAPVVSAAGAVLRRSNSDSTSNERKSANANAKRRISLCAENLSKNKPSPLSRAMDFEHIIDTNDDHRVPSLFCNEELDKDLETKTVGDSDADEYKDKMKETDKQSEAYYSKAASNDRPSVKPESDTSEEDPPGLIWNNGVAVLQGSGLQFQTNEFGLIDLIDSTAHDLININSKYLTPLKQRIDRKNKKVTSPEDLYRCEGCGCHGMAAEFITPNFCSSTCQLEVEKALIKRREREKADLLKKRNKVKKLLIRKQQSESEITSENKELEIVPLKHYDTAPVEVTPDPKPDDLDVNGKYPWMFGKNGFSWMKYLDICKSKAAPVKLFKNPFPFGRNGFRVGMRMEAIDPQHPALFCVVTVAEVQGYRMRLHFDEYPDMYDYWVNADCVDIFPPGWCERNNRTLQPPASYTTSNFSWPSYLKLVRAVAAPRVLFSHVTTTVLRPNCFRIGMKLEAEDRKNDMICAATIADMLDNRLRINFDSWDEMYDYWVEPSSPYIHPVGWAEENNLPLNPPNFYKDPDAFTWDNYLSESNATAAPPRSFKTRLPQGYKPGMKLEVVDRRVPFLIRVATISAVKSHQVRVSFDGWGDDLSYWLDDDSPDLHPVGWCLKTGHPLEPPLTAEELRIEGTCGVGGCRGLGSAHGGAVKTHSAASACPYRARAPSLPERVTTPRPPDTQPRPAPTQRRSRGRPPKHKRIEEVTKNDASDEDSVSSSGGKRWRGSETYSSSAVPFSGPAVQFSGSAPPPSHPPLPPLRANVVQHIADLGLPGDPTLWSQEDVCALVTAVAGVGAGAAARAARLGGAELVMCSREELVCVARMRLGPAVKLYSCVRQLRQLPS